jgi:hypothetical protein
MHRSRNPSIEALARELGFDCGGTVKFWMHADDKPPRVRPVRLAPLLATKLQVIVNSRFELAP